MFFQESDFSDDDSELDHSDADSDCTISTLAEDEERGVTPSMDGSTSIDGSVASLDVRSTTSNGARLRPPSTRTGFTNLTDMAISEEREDVSTNTSRHSSVSGNRPSVVSTVSTVSTHETLFSSVMRQLETKLTFVKATLNLTPVSQSKKTQGKRSTAKMEKGLIRSTSDQGVLPPPRPVDEKTPPGARTLPTRTSKGESALDKWIASSLLSKEVLTPVQEQSFDLGGSAGHIPREFGEADTSEKEIRSLIQSMVNTVVENVEKSDRPDFIGLHGSSTDTSTGTLIGSNTGTPTRHHTKLSSISSDGLQVLSRSRGSTMTSMEEDVFLHSGQSMSSEIMGSQRKVRVCREKVKRECVCVLMCV